MNKITKMLLTVVCASSVMPISGLSANINETALVNEVSIDEKNSEMNIDQMFESFDPTRKVLQLPDGGFMQGIITEYDELNQSLIVVEYNSDIDETSIFIEEAKEIAKNNKRDSERGDPLISMYGISIPTATRVLLPGATYTSAAFSGAGWRLSELKFKPSPGSGNYLLWTSRGDSANAGTQSHASSTISGGVNNGVALANGVSTYVNSADWTMYYTYNPVNGSYYVVQNI